MSGSNQNSNFPRELKGTAMYTSEGRPLTQADLSPRAQERGRKCVRLPVVDDTTIDSTLNTTLDSTTQCFNEYASKGRPFNAAVDISGNHFKRSQHACQYIKPNQRDGHVNLEYEMARNKEIALQRLRSEQSADRSDCPRSTSCYEKPAQIKTSGRGREFNMKAKNKRHQKPVDSSNACMIRSQRRVNAGRPVDLDRVYNYNIQAYSPANNCGRPVDLHRDLTFRRLNLPTPKQQRATSCPTPVQYVSTHSSSFQRMPRICPRPSQSKNVSPTISTSPCETTSRRYVTPMQQIPTTSARPPAYAGMHIPVAGLRETSVNSPANITKTITTTITTRPVSPQQTSLCPIPQSLPNNLTQANNATSRNKRQDMSNVTQDNTTRQLDSAYGKTPPRGFLDSAYGKTPPRAFEVERSYRIPRQPANVTEQTINYSLPTRDNTQIESIRQNLNNPSKAVTTPLNKTIIPPAPPIPPLDQNSQCRDFLRSYRSANQSKHAGELDQTIYYDAENHPLNAGYSPLLSRNGLTSVLPRSPQLRNAPLTESHYYNASMFDEPSDYRKKPYDCLENSYIDLTDETQYQCDDTDIIEQILLRNACPSSHDKRIESSWRLPPEDLSCYEQNGHQTFNVRLPTLSSTKVQTSTGSLETECDTTVHKELPSQLQSERPMCSPCEQPKASLFHCLAKKLSSTYEFLSSLVASQKSATDLALPEDQTKRQVCDETTCDLKNLYATPCNGAARLVSNTPFGNRAQIMDDPTSIRECANAKRCGHVQFNNSDKDQGIQNLQRSIIRKAEMENLVNDTYCPGIIQETIDGRENFNNYSFNLSLTQKSQDNSGYEETPVEDPMTLLEAFAIRIEYQRAEIEKDLKENATEEQIQEKIDKHFAQQNPSDLNRSIKSLLLSERLQEQEQVAKSKGTSFEADVQKLVTAFPFNSKIKLIAYTGHTKPKADDTI